jgi:hypothetical protein
VNCENDVNDEKYQDTRLHKGGGRKTKEEIEVFKCVNLMQPINYAQQDKIVIAKYFEFHKQMMKCYIILQIDTTYILNLMFLIIYIYI